MQTTEFGNKNYLQSLRMFKVQSFEHKNLNKTKVLNTNS